MIVFSGTSKLAIQAAYSQQNCGGGTANNDAFVVSAVSNLNNIYRGKIYISKPLHLLATHFHIRDCRVLSLSLSDHDMFFLHKTVKLDESCPRNKAFQELCKIRPCKVL